MKNYSFNSFPVNSVKLFSFFFSKWAISTYDRLSGKDLIWIDKRERDAVARQNDIALGEALPWSGSFVVTLSDGQFPSVRCDLQRKVESILND